MMKTLGASWHAVCDQAYPVLENLQEETPKMLVGFAVISFQCHLFHVMF